MKKISFYLLLICCAFRIQAQSCLPDGIILSTQTEVDNFKSNYPGCTEIEGYLAISGSEISNLNGLLGLNKIGEDLRIQNNSNLINLRGLDSLREIGHDLSISESNGLINLEGLENLEIINGTVDIMDNYNLINLEGLEGLNSTSAVFSIIYNNSLQNFAGLDNINFVGMLYIVGNPALSSFSGLENLKSIQWDLTIRSNSGLTNLNGFTNLESIGRELEIRSNLSLIDCSGLERLKSVGGNLSLSFNPILTSLNGLDNLESLYLLNINNNPMLKDINALENISFIDQYHNYIYIQNNDSLSDCAIRSICVALDNPGLISLIDKNAAGCISKAEIDAACGDLSVATISLPVEFSIYPNPSNNEFTIEIESINPGDQLIICDLKGLEINSFLLTSTKTRIVLEDIHPGIYLLKIRKQNTIHAKKLIVYKTNL